MPQGKPRAFARPGGGCDAAKAGTAGGGGTGALGPPGGARPHVPVLAREVVELLAPRDGGVYVDATFGAGGHTRLILAAADCRVIALDRDSTAVAAGYELVAAAQGRLTLIEERFSALERAVAPLAARIDGILIDLGVSSMQLDRGERGFSFRHDGPLDMRMGSHGPTAADLVASASERDLARIIAVLGEERFARPVARAIVARRQRSPLTTTRALAEVVASVIHARPHEIHPATRTFQALRIFLNEELSELAEALAAAERLLAPAGRLAVISFHSLEDRIVKRFLAARSRAAAVSRHQPLTEGPAPSFRTLTPRAVTADDAEIAANPRARSAKLRVAERTRAPVSTLAVEALPDLPALADALKGR
ncbi:MAG: 16S rRNA (cytosine(1402)-N(4))-methyltransferase RsmH [Variibacter sp.]|nr:16S rRNA (cytosine(1402)-N(4))-methyltransferase RsmH [Variibacter sp.]